MSPRTANRWAAMPRAVSVVGLYALSSKEKLDPDKLKRALRLLAGALHEVREHPENWQRTAGLVV
jgi:hypothetical protein